MTQDEILQALLLVSHGRIGPDVQAFAQKLAALFAANAPRHEWTPVAHGEAHPLGATNDAVYDIYPLSVIQALPEALKQRTRAKKAD